MKLSHLFSAEELPMELRDLEVKGLQDDSRLVQPGDLFIARSGSGDDGSRYIAQALSAGAVAAVADRAGERTITVDNPTERMEQLAKKFWGLEGETPKLWGVTGTNGKTTLTFLMEAALRADGREVGLLGTVTNRIAGEVRPSRLTTPGLLELYRFVAEVKEKGLNDLVLEVSSHALDQHRLGSLRLSAAAFTNLTQDHLDYHGSMESYFLAKRKMFSEYLADNGRGVVNVDDEYGRRIYSEFVEKIWRVSKEDRSAEIHLIKAENEGHSQKLQVSTPAGELLITSPLIGLFNQENLLLAAGFALAAGVAPRAIEKGFASVSVPGRMELVCEGEAAVVVDYAHTPDALERVLQSVRSNVTGELIALFGCGGDRDRTKRPKMGKAAAQWADRLVLTSDNPRTEDRLEILKEIELGVPAGKAMKVIPDRREAIHQTISELRTGDLLLIAGKGHEDYQIIGKEKVPFDDRVEAQKAWEARYGS